MAIEMAMNAHAPPLTLPLTETSSTIPSRVIVLRPTVAAGRDTVPQYSQRSASTVRPHREHLRLSSTGHVESGYGFSGSADFVGLDRVLPRELLVVATEVTVRSRLLVDRTAQVEIA